MELAEKLFAHREIDSNGCWNWTANKDGGYGRVRVGKYQYKVSRVAAALWLNFDTESKELILHKCDNKACFNPDHLYIGDASDNSYDRVERGGKKNQHVNKMYCKNGHEFTPENTYIVIRWKENKRKTRVCKICKHQEYIKKKNFQ